MDIEGEYFIDADREHVWDLLNDPETLKKCIPGCESIEQQTPDTFSGKVVLKIGPMKASFNGDIELKDKVFPSSYRIVGEGKGGIAGFASGDAVVNLAAENGGTRLTYKVDAKLGGKIAQLGSRLVGSTSSKLANQFFSTFGEIASQPEGALGEG